MWTLSKLSQVTAFVAPPKDAKTVSKRMLMEIGIGWISTPLLSGLISYGIVKVFQGGT